MYWPLRELVNQSNNAVVIDETSTVDTCIDDKIKQYLLETEVYGEREGDFLENMELDNESLGSTDKNRKCCSASIANGSLNIVHNCCSMKTIFSHDFSKNFNTN